MALNDTRTHVIHTGGVTGLPPNRRIRFENAGNLN